MFSSRLFFKWQTKIYHWKNNDINNNFCPTEDIIFKLSLINHTGDYLKTLKQSIHLTSAGRNIMYLKMHSDIFQTVGGSNSAARTWDELFPFKTFLCAIPYKHKEQFTGKMCRQYFSSSDHHHFSMLFCFLFLERCSRFCYWDISFSFFEDKCIKPMLDNLQ